MLCAALLGGSLVACRQNETPEDTTPPTGTPLGEVTDPDELADGTYWATLPAMNWWAAGEDGPELSLILVELDPDTMTITGGDPYQGDSVTLPVAEDVELGNYGDNGLSNFLTWSMLSSYYPMVLEVEVTGGEIAAMTWHDASLPGETPTSAAVPAVVHAVDPEAGTLTYAVDDGNVGVDSEWIEARVHAGAADLSVLAQRVNPLSSWGLPCTLYLENETTVSGIKAGPLADGAYYIGRVNNYTATLAEDGSVLAFDAWLYEVDPETCRVTRALGEAEFWLGWLDESGPEPVYRPYEGVALYNEDGTPYGGSVTQFLEEFTADSDALEQARRRYNTLPAVDRLTLQVTVGGGVVTSMQRLPAPGLTQPVTAVSLE